MKAIRRITQQFLYFFTALFIVSVSGIHAQSDGHNETASSIQVSSSDYSSKEWMACPAPLDVEGCHIMVLQGDPSQANADVMFKLKGGASVPEHWHSSAERMVLISGELHVTYEGEETKVLKEGDYAYGPANKPHKAKCADGTDCMLFIAFEKPVDSYVE